MCGIFAYSGNKVNYDQIITKLTDENVQSEEFAYALWQASQVELTAEIDDASLIVINKH